MTFVKKKKKKKKGSPILLGCPPWYASVLICQNIDELAYFKETKSATIKSATMIIFRKKFFSKNGVCKSRIKSCFLNKSVHYS